MSGEKLGDFPFLMFRVCQITGESWFGRPNALHPNCEPLGLICIIQENNKACPDDSWSGGIITFEFREPVEFVKSMTFIDLKITPTPNVTIFYDGGKSITTDTQDTGDNGVYTLPFKTSLYQNVTRIEITVERHGSISSLEYPYCSKPLKPQIAVKKYAGPPDLCTASGIASMQDVVYTLPSNGAPWAYCYVVSVPSTSEECLYDITLRDSAPIGGTGGRSVTGVSETLCQGQRV